MTEQEIVRISAAARFKFRSDTLANWEAANPTLLSGELSVVTDSTDESERVKIGDGVTPWNELGWWKGPKGDTGAVGPQGEKGDPGKDAATDQTYNPESQNAQSGAAVAEALTLKMDKFGEVVREGETDYRVEGNDAGTLTIKSGTLQFTDFGGGIVLRSPQVIDLFSAGGVVCHGSILYDIGDPANDTDGVNRRYVDNKIGDISTALDELHTYAQALVSGGASE